MSRSRFVKRTIAALLFIVIAVIPGSPIRAQGVNTALIKLTYRCGNWFRIRNLNAVNVSVQYSVYRTSETGPVTLPAAPTSIGYGDTWLNTTNTGAVVLTYNGARVAEKPNGGAACATVASMGQWTDTLSWPIMSIASAVLPNGNVISYGREFAAEIPPHYVIPPGRFDGVPFLWNPTTGVFTNVDTPLHVDFFCSGLTMMNDGSLIIMGGHAGIDGVGQRFNYRFNYQTNSWTVDQHMAAGRWYPDLVSMADGDIFVISGSDTNKAIDSIPEVYHPASDTYTELTGIPVATPIWAWMFVAPNGQLFYGGDRGGTYFIDPTGTGTNILTQQNSLTRDYGTAVMYDAGKIMKTGGDNPGYTSAEVIDLNQTTPNWTASGSMAFPRRQMNGVIMANGQVMVSGGSSGPDFNPATNIVYTPEVWDPVTQVFTPKANYKMPRLYHSETLLLLDGRILSVGGGQPAATGLNDNFNAEIYSPTYLFNPDGSAVTASRPIITSAPPQVTYGQNFSVQVQNVAAGTAKVLWIRIGAVTHTINMSQRLNHLAASQAGNTITVRAPASANLAPPGHYILFVLNANGVPSAGSVIQIQ